MPAKKKKAAHRRPKGRKPARKRTKRASLIRSLIIALACVLGVLAVIVAGGSLWMWQKLGMVDYDDSSIQYLDSLPPEEEDDLLLPEGEEIEELESSANSGTPTRPDNGLSDIAVQGSDDGITNILLLGIDAESGYVGRSDVMMLLSIDKNRKTIRLISFLRDTLITIPGRDKDGDGLDDYAKLNAAYAYGGFDLLSATMRENFRLKIDEYIGVNFPAFSACVEAMNGVEITLTAAEAEVVGIRAADGTYQAGTYLLNGEQALTYARIRKLDSDFGRTERQRKLISALIAKAKTMDVFTLNRVLDAVLGDVRTNMSKGEFAGFILDAVSYSSYAVEASYHLPQDGAYRGVSGPGVGSSLQLTDPAASVRELHEYIYG